MVVRNMIKNFNQQVRDYSDLPFKVLEYSETRQLRYFSQVFTEDELDWHRDREDRTINLISGSNWLIQLDNELPVLIESGKSYQVPAGLWHRVIRTDKATDMVLEILMGDVKFS